MPDLEVQVDAALTLVENNVARLATGGAGGDFDGPALREAVGRLEDILAKMNAAVAVTGPVTDAELRATALTVDGTVAVSNPTADPETGLAKDITLTDGSVRVGGTTVVSAAALPLPAGAATDATGQTILAAVDGLEALATSQDTKLNRLPASGAASEVTQLGRYGGGKLAATAQVTASGDTTILTPTSGKAVTVWWATALNDPDAAATPKITLRIGGMAIYSSYAIAHWEPFTGALDAPVIVNLDSAGDVAVTIHYTEA